MRSRFFYSLIMLLLVNTTTAQLCQGSLGDPVVNTTFGAGTNPGPALSAAATTYQYVGADCPNDGYYTVRNNTSNCFGTSWHSFNGDHTGNANGYFMLVNASVQPSAFYIDTVHGLCGSTSYEFAAWIMNVLLPSACGGTGNQPNLTFSIEKTNGAVLQSYNSGNIPSTSSAQWKQYGFFFATPSGVTDVVLRIVNNAPGGCGNDLALDDITFRPCGPQLNPAIVGVSSTTAVMCAGSAQGYTFTSTISGGFNNPAYQWQQYVGNNWTDIPGETNSTMTMNFPASTQAGNYLFRVTVIEASNIGSPGCRVNSQPLTIQVNAQPVTTATSNSPVCEGGLLLLTATGGAQFNWSGPNSFSATGSPVTVGNAQQINSGKYYVQVSDNGCSKTDSTVVSINPVPAATVLFSDTTICEGRSVQFFSSGGSSYQWIPTAGLSSSTIANPVASPADTTNYMVIVSNQFSCKDTAYVNVNSIEAPKANAGPDKVIIAGHPVQIKATVTGQGINYAWSPALYIDDINSLTPMLNPPADQRYILNAGSSCGITADTMFVYVYKGLYIPNAFTPNGDGLNDTWNIPALNAFPEHELYLYNRYGQVIYQTKNNFIPWDGTFKSLPVNAGTYTYMINLKNGMEVLKGVVIVVR